MPLLANYREWVKVADTALPQNMVGYLVQACLSPLRADPFTLLPYDDPNEIAKCGVNTGIRSFLPSKLPKREGPRPEMLKWIAPNRQVSQLGDEDTRKVCYPLANSN